jgi:hypothetical protein
MRSQRRRACLRGVEFISNKETVARPLAVLPLILKPSDDKAK